MSDLADFDIVQLYRLFLLRDPASQAELDARRGGTVTGLLREFVGSAEFRTNLQAALRERRLPEAPAWQLPAGATAGWAATALPLEDVRRAAVAAAATWPDLIAELFADEAFRREVEGVNPAAGSAAFAATAAAYAVALRGRAIAGGVDAMARDQVVGWAVDRLALDAPVALTLHVDGELVAQTTTRLFRRDLQDAMGGGGRYGFGFTADQGGMPEPPSGATLEVREAQSGLLIGQGVLDPAPGPGPVRRLQDDAARAAIAMGWLQRCAQELGAAATFPLSEYGAWARAYGRETFRAERERVRAAEALEGVARISLLVSPAGAPLDHAPLLDSLERQQAPGWEAVLLSPEAHAPALRALVAGLEPQTRARCCVVTAEAPDLNAAALAEATGDHLLLLEGGDAIAPDAVAACLGVLSRPEPPRVLFGDDDLFEPGGDGELLRSTPRLRGAFDPDLLMQEDALGPVLCVHRGALERVLAEGASLALSRRHDLALRLSEAEPDRIDRVPGLLAHLRLGGRAAARAGAALSDVQDHLSRSGSAAVARLAPAYPGARAASTIRVEHPLPPARAAVIIPTRDGLDLLAPCLDGLQRHRADNLTALEVIVVDNGSEDAATLAFLDAREAAGEVRVLRSDAPFNFAALNNLAASETDADLLVLMNNDIEVLSPDWLDALARHALRPEVGAVGARLVYEDLTLQHAGVVTGGIHELTAHEGVGAPLADGGYLQRHARTRRASAVTGACLATRRGVWDRLGGLDAARFAVDGNDVDYGLRAGAAGLAVIYTPDCTMFHHESKSRGFAARTEASRARAVAEVARLRERWGARLAHDPWYNPAFDRGARPFQRLGPPPPALPRRDRGWTSPT